MKRYGIIKKVQLGDYGDDCVIGTGKSKEEKRRDRKRARQRDKKLTSLDDQLKMAHDRILALRSGE